MRKLLLLISLSLLSGKAVAEGGKKFNWQLDVGFGVSHGNNIVPAFDSKLNGAPQLQIQFNFEYKNWFAEATSVRSGYVFGNPTLGYRLLTGDNSNVAIVMASYHFGFGPTVSSRDGLRISSLEGLNNREHDLAPGLRYQQQLSENQLFSLQLSKDLKAYHGEMFSLFYGHRFEYNNWDLYLNTELNWHSAKLINYYYGVSTTESTPDRPEYQAGSGWRQHFGLVGVYPLHPKWVIELGSGINWYSKAHTNSPLTRDKPEWQSFVIFRYVYK
ncbi:MipA/OmpV family protein [Rheinheimera gaetbuli]